MQKKPAVAGNTATGTLKWVALVFMMIDHSGKMLFPNIPEMRLLGRIAFPLYCWGLVVGTEYTSSMPKYLLRILLTGIISQPLYMMALNHTWNQPSVFLTLFLAVLGLWESGKRSGAARSGRLRQPCCWQCCCRRTMDGKGFCWSSCCMHQGSGKAPLPQ